MPRQQQSFDEEMAAARQRLIEQLRPFSDSIDLMRRSSFVNKITAKLSAEHIAESFEESRELAVARRRARRERQRRARERYVGQKAHRAAAASVA
jgi:hypothetical protein